MTKWNPQFPLHNHSPGPDHLPRGIADDQDVVLVPFLGHPVVPLRPRFLGDVAHGRQDAQHVEDAGGVVGALQRAHCIFFGEGRGDKGGNEGGGEEGAVGVVGHGGVAGRDCGGLPHFEGGVGEV